MTKNKAKSDIRKTLIPLILADILVVALAVIAVMAVLPLFSIKHIENTANALLFDSSKISEIMSGNALEFSAEFDIPEKLTEFDGDLHLAVGSAHDKSNGNGKANLSFGVGDKSLSLNLLYNSETVTLGGLDTDKSTPVSLPRRGLKEAFDKSKFYFVSGSLHSMSMMQYNRLIPALDSALDPDRADDADALSDIIDDAIRIANPTSSFVFSKGKLCRRYTCSLDAEKTVKILGLFADIDEAQIQAIKDSIGDKTFTLTYVTDGKYIISAQISSAAVKADIEFVYDGNTNGFKADVIYTFDNSGEAIGIIGKTEYEFTYVKTVTDSEITADLTVWSQSEGSRDYSLKLNKADSSYSLKLNENELATGVCELDGEKLNLTVTNSENASALVSLMLRKVEKVVTEMPEHRSLFDMSEDELTEFLRSIPIKTASDILKTLSGLDLSAYMTADGKLLMHADKIMTEAQKIYGSYVSLLKSTERKLLDSVSKIYVWNDRLKAYILFTYLRNTDSLELGCAYELTEEILAEYHIANLTYNGIMSVHDLVRTVNNPPECTSDGLEVWDCQYCDYGYETVLPSPGHQTEYPYPLKASYRHDGSFVQAGLRRCTVCNNIQLIDIGNYCSYWLESRDGGSYIITLYEPKSAYTLKNLYVPLPEETDINITEMRITDENEFLTIAFPEGIRKIGANSVRLTYSFKTLYLPSTLEVIEDNAFYGQGKVKTIVYAGTKEDWDKLPKGNYSEIWKDVQIIFS